MTDPRERRFEIRSRAPRSSRALPAPSATHTSGFRDAYVDAGFRGKALVDAREQRAPTGEKDAAATDVGGELGRR